MKKIIMKKCFKYLLITFFGINLILILLSFIINIDKEDMKVDSVFPPSLNLLSYDESRNHQKIYPDEYLNNSQKNNLIDDENYDKKVYNWINDDVIEFDLYVDTNAKYYIAIDYKSLQEDVQEISINVDIDNEVNEKYQNIILPTYWTNSLSSDERVYDIYQNEVTKAQISYKLWINYYLYDQRFYDKTPLIFELTEGTHKIKISKSFGALLLGNIYIEKYRVFDDYDTPQEVTSNNNMLVIEGENPLFKSSPDITSTSSQMTHLTPYSTSKNMLNNLDGGSFNESGQSVTYAFDVKESGYYKIALKYYISQTNTSIYTKIKIDNNILYNELNGYCFKNNLNNKKTSYDYEVLNKENNEMMFYLEKGIHTLTIQLDASIQSKIYYELVKLIDEINELYLEVIKLTGGNTDKNKTWNILQYIPDASTRLNDWKERIKNLLTYIEEVSKSNKNKQNRLYQQIDNAYKKISELAKNPNKLPHKLNLLVDGSASASLMLSNSLHTSTFNPLSIDKIYIYGNGAKLPKISNNFFKNYIATVQRILRTTVDKTDKDTLKIWVNRSTFYVSLMQQFADAYYTPETGVKVRFSLLPDESKLTYANASNTQPDAAFGVGSGVPYTLGIRGALVDLHKFPTFGKTIKTMTPGSILSLLEGEKVYGIPETQDFQVTFYREDILNSLGIEVPKTYEDIIEIVPTLQRYGMNYYMPLAGGSGLKSLGTTAPFIYQYGGNIYSEDYTTVNIDSKEAISALQMMVDLFALYSLPLTTQNFYNNFRSGLSPVGVSGFDTYLQLTNAAPEIVGKWKLAPVPGALNEDNTINRTHTADNKTIVIFEKSKKQQEAWDFISWWMSTEIQSKFATDLQSTYGARYLWNSANLEAFKKLAINEEDKKIILEQLKYIYQIPQTPATYMVERGISNIWNSCVFDSVSLRGAVTNYSLEINREMKRKMVEFKYMDNDGNILKKYYVPTILDIMKWQEE